VENPYEVDPNEDYTHAIADGVELWSENYFFQFYDPAQQVGLWTHLGRMPHDPTIWRSLVTAFLPGGEVLVGKAYGPGPEPAGRGGPSNGTLAFRCDRPLTDWTVSGEALVRRTSLEQLAGGLHTDGPVIPLSFRYEFEALTPIWDLGAATMSGQSWALTHYEQPGLVVGQVRCGDRSWAVAGAGIRDHSYGPRDFAHFRRGSWVHAEFPSGRVFVALRMWSNDDRVALDSAFICEDGKLREATPVDMPTLESAVAEPRRGLVRLDDGGRAVEVEFEVLTAKTMTLAEPNEPLYGADRADPGVKILNDAIVRCRWDGEVGYGLCERSRRIEDLSTR
jgi:hypothetical protein